MFRAKHQPSQTPSFFSQTTQSQPQPVYPLSTILGLPLERGTCCFLVHSRWSGGVQINKLFGSGVDSNAFPHFICASLTQPHTALPFCNAFLTDCFPSLGLSIFLRMCVFTLLILQFKKLLAQAPLSAVLQIPRADTKWTVYLSITVETTPTLILSWVRPWWKNFSKLIKQHCSSGESSKILEP